MRSLLLAVGLSCLLIGPVHASPCGEVTSAGVCHDTKTLLFCDKGRLEQVHCPEGEICTHDDRFDGAAGCLATHAIGCGDVSERGQCARSDLLLFCEQRAVIERTCPVGTACAWVPEEGWYDCVPRGLPGTSVDDEADTPDAAAPGAPEPEEVEPEEVEAPSDPVLPSVDPGGAPAAEDFEASGGGCLAGGTSPLALLGVLGWLLGGLVRRRV